MRERDEGETDGERERDGNQCQAGSLEGRPIFFNTIATVSVSVRQRRRQEGRYSPVAMKILILFQVLGGPKMKHTTEKERKTRPTICAGSVLAVVVTVSACCFFSRGGIHPAVFMYT